MRTLIPFMICCSFLFADEPLPPPKLKTLASPDGQVNAVMDPKTMTTTVHAIDEGEKRELWSMQGWYRTAYLANDGIHMVVGYDGENLIPLNYRQDMVMITFFAWGRVVGEVHLFQIIDRLANLEQTASHYNWGRFLGIDDEGRFVVETVEQRRLYFDIRDGHLLDKEIIKP